MTTIALVVTYNRKELLKECLDALLNQSVSLNKIIIFNNNSTDGTEDLFGDNGIYDNDKIELINSSTNLGGAGGFCEGIKIAYNYGCDWVWIMDDDTIPDQTALEQLQLAADYLSKKEKKISFLASYVYGPENEPMNVPDICFDKCDNGYSYWYKYLDEGLVPIKRATFVSLLISGKAINEVGYPIAEYFIWGDDSEYTQRLVKGYGAAFFCGKSKVLHKRTGAQNVSIYDEEDKNRIPLYKFAYRNKLLNAREFHGEKGALLRWIKYFGVSFSLLVKPHVKFRGLKFLAVQKGIWAFIFKPIRRGD